MIALQESSYRKENRIWLLLARKKIIKKAANNVSVRGSFSPFLFLFVSKKGTFYLSVNVFSTKVLNAWGHYIFTPPNGDGTAILRGHPSHGKVSLLAVQREYLISQLFLRPLVLVRPRESNPRPPTLCSQALY